jgi:hypothetical protein
MSSVKIVIVEKNGTLKEQVIKSFNENELYKKAGFKTNEHFKCYTEWNIEEPINGKTFCISVYGKTKGRANQENKYDFPPPIDNTLFFGNCLIVNKFNNQIANLSLNEWEIIYQHLFGGFEDLDDEELNDELELEEAEDEPVGKYGYVKDGFVVDDDEDEDDDYDEEEDYDEEDEDVKKPIKKMSKNKKSKSTKLNDHKKIPKEIEIKEVNKLEEDVLECTSELSEEEYV